jgi:DNA-binding CsgD family transcriptional regulator
MGCSCYALKKKLAKLVAEYDCEVTPLMEQERVAKCEAIKQLSKHDSQSYILYDLKEDRIYLHPFRVEASLSTEGIKQRIHTMTHPDDHAYCLDTEIKGFEYLMALPPELRKDFRMSYQRRMVNEKGLYRMCLHSYFVFECDCEQNPWLILILTEHHALLHPEQFRQMRYCIPCFDKNSNGLPEYPFEKECMLTGTEKKVLRMINEKAKNEFIAQQLAIEVSTVKKHRSNMMAKFNVSSLHLVIRLAIKIGMMGLSTIVTPIIDLLVDWC